jgi:hypothetical protein
MDARGVRGVVSEAVSEAECRVHSKNKVKECNSDSRLYVYFLYVSFIPCVPPMTNIPEMGRRYRDDSHVCCTELRVGLVKRMHR